MAKNKVIAGSHIDANVSKMLGGVYITRLTTNTRIPLDKTTVKSCELLTDDARKSMGSSVGRGIVGGALLGPIGMIGGAMSGKNKKTYTIDIVFLGGDKSIVEVEEKIYKLIMRAVV